LRGFSLEGGPSWACPTAPGRLAAVAYGWGRFPHPPFRIFAARLSGPARTGARDACSAIMLRRPGVLRRGEARFNLQTKVSDD